MTSPDLAQRPSTSLPMLPIATPCNGPTPRSSSAIPAFTASSMRLSSSRTRAWLAWTRCASEPGLRPRSMSVSASPRCLQQEDLDFTLFFSSAQSFSKSPGQSNYAAGCTFKDAFASALSRHWRGRVKVINWGYWGHTGIVSSPDYQERMQQAGIGSIEPEKGLAALDALLNGPLDQVVLMKLTKLAVGGQ